MPTPIQPSYHSYLSPSICNSTALLSGYPVLLRLSVAPSDCRSISLCRNFMNTPRHLSDLPLRVRSQLTIEYFGIVLLASARITFVGTKSIRRTKTHPRDSKC